MQTQRFRASTETLPLFWKSNLARCANICSEIVASFPRLNRQFCGIKCDENMFGTSATLNESRTSFQKAVELGDFQAGNRCVLPIKPLPSPCHVQGAYGRHSSSQLRCPKQSLDARSQRNFSTWDRRSSATLSFHELSGSMSLQCSSMQHPLQAMHSFAA